MTDADLARWEALCGRLGAEECAVPISDAFFALYEAVPALLAEVRRLRAERMAPPTTAFCPKCAAQQYPVPDADWIDVANRARRAWGLPPIQRLEPKNA